MTNRAAGILVLLVLAATTTATLNTASATDIEMLPQPCRIIDTRVTSSPIGANSSVVYSLDAAMATGQGGASGCGIPSTAKVAKIIVHATPTTAAGGYIKVYDGSITSPQVFASHILFVAGQFSTTQLDVSVSNLQVAIYASPQTHVVVDVAGWIDGGGSATDDAPRLRRFLTITNAPFAPGAISTGDRLLVAASGTVGAFAGHENEWVYWDGSGWVFEVPRDGDLGFEAATGKYYRFRNLGSAGWKEIALVP